MVGGVQTYDYNQIDADVIKILKTRKKHAVHSYTPIWEFGNNEHQYKCDIVHACNLIDDVNLEIYNIATHNVSDCDIGGLP